LSFRRLQPDSPEQGDHDGHNQRSENELDAWLESVAFERRFHGPTVRKIAEKYKWVGWVAWVRWGGWVGWGRWGGWGWSARLQPSGSWEDNSF
jgi:hypothetical protein